MARAAGTDYDMRKNDDAAGSTTETNAKKHRKKFLRETPSIQDMEIRKLIGKYPIAVTKDVKESNTHAKTGTLDIIRQVNEELFSGNTKRYSNFVNMGMLYEDYTINQNQKTAELLKEIATSDTKTLKKAYNFRLVDMLEAQESAWEVMAEFKNGQNDPSRFAFAKMEKGQYKRFMKKKRN